MRPFQMIILMGFAGEPLVSRLAHWIYIFFKLNKCLQFCLHIRFVGKPSKCQKKKSIGYPLYLHQVIDQIL